MTGFAWFLAGAFVMWGVGLLRRGVMAVMSRKPPKFEPVEPISCGWRGIGCPLHIHHRLVVQCDDCGLEGPTRYSEAEAIGAWNERERIAK